MRIPKAKYITAVLLAIASFALQQAKGDFISFLNVGNTSDPGISGFPGPYGTVTVHLDSSTMANHHVLGPHQQREYLSIGRCPRH
jgi:hypothetical protein